MLIRYDTNYSIICRQKDLPLVRKAKDLMDKIVYNQLDFALFIPYITPPLSSVRYDGEVNVGLFRNEYLKEYTTFSSPRHLIYKISLNYFNSQNSGNYDFVEIGRHDSDNITSTFDDTKIIIPHKGGLHLLKRCVNFLNKTEAKEIQKDIVFDSYGFIKFSDTVKASKHLNIYRNKPLNVGPYPGRHELIVSDFKEFIIFQDSDDISSNFYC